MVSTLVALLILLVVVVIACYIINLLLPQQPANQIAKLVVGVLALIYVLQHLGLLSGHL